MCNDVVEEEKQEEEEGSIKYSSKANNNKKERSNINSDEYYISHKYQNQIYWCNLNLHINDIH